MFKKFNTSTLLIILVLLGGLSLLNKFYCSKKSENTFESSFVQIDSNAVKQIFIYPKAEKGKEIKLTKTDKGWDLQNDKLKTTADSAEVHRLLSMFSDVKVNSLAAEDKSGWADFQVNDSLGSRIKFVTDNKTYEMIVGKFGFNAGARNGITYIRRMGEDKVYGVDGYISFNVNRDFTGWRNKLFMSGNKDAWTSLTFSYPADSGFTLSRQGSSWTLNGMPVDSNKTNQYLSQLANKQSAGFVEGYSQTGAPAYSLTIGGGKDKPVILQAFPADSTQKFILHSSLNPDGWFSEVKNPMMESIFVGKGKFLKE